MPMPTPITPQTQSRGPVARAFFRALRIGATLSVLVAAGVTVQLAAGFLAQRADAVPAPDAAPVTPVSVTPLVPETGYSIDRTFIGQVEARQSVDMSFELAGKLSAVHFDEGDHVQSGDILASLDTSLLDAERTRLASSRKAIEAQRRFADQTVERNSRLTERGFTSQARLDEALARQDELASRMAELDAALHDVALRVEKSAIRAPFSGRIAARQADGGATLRPGEPVLGLVETGSRRVRIGVPLDVDQSALTTARINIAGQSFDADLVSLRPDVDPVTRTRTALFEIPAGAEAAFGQTARLVVTEIVESDGVWISTTALKEGQRGQWNILVVDDQNIVRTASVELLHADKDRVFARGVFPKGTALINQGPQRVTLGQRVAPQATN